MKRRPIVVAAFCVAALAAAPARAQQETAPQGEAQQHDKASSAAGKHASSHAPMKMDDAEYVRMMKMHHEQGIRMAKLAIEKARRAEVKQFAQKAADHQQKDMAELARLEQAVGGSRHASSHGAAGATPEAHPEGTAGTAHDPGAAEKHARRKTAGGDDMMQSGHLMMGQHMLQNLENASGADFDREFVRSMIMHHQMAIDMSKATSQFKSAEVKAFAAETARKQAAEVKELEAMQGGAAEQR